MSSTQLGTCGKIIKIVFIVMNALYLLIGLALIALGSYLIHEKHDLDYFSGSGFITGAALFITCGVVIFLITALGVAGGLFQHKFLLFIYLFIVVLIMVLEVVAAIIGFVYRGRISDTATNRANDAIQRYRQENDDDYDSSINEAVDYIQNEFDCCGWDDANVWETTEYFNETGMYPTSCECNSNVTDSSSCIEINEEQFVYNTTCQSEVASALRKGVAAAGGVAIAFAVAQLIPFLLAIALIYHIRKGSGYVTV